MRKIFVACSFFLALVLNPLMAQEGRWDSLKADVTFFMGNDLGRNGYYEQKPIARMMGEMAEEEQVMLNQIQYSITEYLKEFNKDYQYGVILSTTTAGPIFNADPKLDITTVLLEGLNKKYASEKGKNKNSLPATPKADAEATK